MDPRPSRSLVQKEGIYSVTGQIFLKFDKKEVDLKVRGWLYNLVTF